MNQDKGVMRVDGIDLVVDRHVDLKDLPREAAEALLGKGVVDVLLTHQLEAKDNGVYRVRLSEWERREPETATDAAIRLEAYEDLVRDAIEALGLESQEEFEKLVDDLHADRRAALMGLLEKA